MNARYRKKSLRGLSHKCFFLKKWAKPGLFLVYFHSFSQSKDKYSTNFTIIDKSIDGVLGSRTQGGMMEGADEYTELWRHPMFTKEMEAKNRF